MKMKMKMTKKDSVLLKEIIKTTEEKGFMFVGLLQTKKMTELEYIETNLDMTDPADNNKVATRPTQKGVDYLASLDNPKSKDDFEVTDQKGVSETSESLVDVPPVESPYEIEKGIPVPVTTRGRNKNSYPFDTMEVNDSFHVAATEENPNPTKTMASAVSNANAKNKVDGVEMKRFLIRRTNKTDLKGIGARVFRIVV